MIESTDTSRSGSAVTCVQASGKGQQDALSLLLTGRVSGGGPAVEQFRAFADQQRLSLEQTWVALQNGTPIASALIVPSPGRTAMIFLSRVGDADSASISGELARHACLGQGPSRLRLVQALLEPHQQHECEALTDAGFSDLATLLYMERKKNLTYQPLALDGELQVQQWDQTHHDTFAAAILASYEDTQDCPGLLGLRRIEDIMAGHRSTGEFDPALWFSVSHGGEPVGVMLLNKVPQRQALELVYLGLSPRWRGRGLARRLLEHGVGLAARHRMTNVMLAVDANNKPALALYGKMDFVECGRKIAMIFTLNENNLT